METKEKLLTLAIACLNNKEFYALSSLSGHYALPSNQVNNQRIVCSPDKTRHRLSLIDIRRTHINEVKCKYSDITDFDQTIYDKIKKEYEDENNKFSEEVYYYLNILFNDNPPININFYSNINSSQIIDKFEVPIRKIDLDARFFISDGKEMIFMISKTSESEQDTGIWINSDFFVAAMKGLVDAIWER